MMLVSCPSCGEKGKIPDGFGGTRIKCRKCGTGFQVADPAGSKPAPTPSPTSAAAAVTATAAVSSLRGDEIVVDGLDDGAWATATAAGASPRVEPPASVAATQDFQPIRGPDPGTIKQYKLLTPRDRYFEGKFDLARLEEALNHFARDGWVVRGMATPHVVGFQGEKEELVILLER